MAALGMKLDGLATEDVPGLARAIEAHHLDEVWICEDLGLNGGIAQSAIALGVTERVRVGHGIAPAAVRNVAYFAMEVASLCRAFPGRFLPGIGHGMPGWLKQVGAHPGKLLPCLAETTEMTARLLAGETVSCSGEWVHLDNVSLRYPPAQAPPISLGVRGPRGMDIAARVADGVILAEGSGPSYVRRVVEQMGRPEHRVTVFAWFSIDDDSDAARERIRGTVASALEQEFMRSQLGLLTAEGPTDRVLTELTVSGAPAECAAAIRALSAAGADSVVLQPVPGSEAEQLARIRDELLPLLND
jgi:alkanesulfonate monooxygenase SsuD/methylene tetrahydromethanopterin reductase-like flavin-dependent oxidoreductase (luciferase family)